ncbi:MAG: FAD-dependent oxidoreductase, partial [Phycisphaerales bacterium]
LDTGLRGNARPANHYDDQQKSNVVRAEESVHLFLNMHAYEVEMKGNHIAAVIARHILNSTRHRFTAPLFADCTGDGTLGFLAGADYRMGRESRAQTGESLAPEKPDKMTMGASVQWYSSATGKPESFPDCPWALQFTEESCHYLTRGDWDWETGMNRDQIGEFEFIRDHALRAVYGNWAFVKNHSKGKAKFTDRKLDWVAFIAGKRESRRLLGDIILQQQDIQSGKTFPDSFVTTTWSIDLHYPAPDNTKYFPGNEFRSIAKFTKIKPYPIPYRSLYSRNVGNMLMAGRCISVTHVALGTVRVMRTGGMMGELIGMAASLCKKHNTNPRGVYENHLEELKELARCGVGKPAWTQ